MNSYDSPDSPFLSKEDLSVLTRLFDKFENFNVANTELERLCGLKYFFSDNSEFLEFKKYIESPNTIVFTRSAIEWGDYQTPNSLTDNICRYLKKSGITPTIIIEPTYGSGNFIFSCLDFFPSAKCIYGIEIQKKYEILFKISLLKRIAQNKKNNTEIIINLDDIFSHVFPKHLFKENEEFLIIGNPPWVTSSVLSSVGSNNLPIKNNFKQFSGMDALTGKSNFDIAEYIILKMLLLFSNQPGSIVFICKNIVIKNILYNLPKSRFKIFNIKALEIDAKKEFNVSCDASIFYAKMGENNTDFSCEVSLFESPEKIIRRYGWVDGNFVSDIEKYSSHKFLDGKSEFEWRSGVKHDLAKVMELKNTANGLINKMGDVINIEQDQIFPLLKSSDLKKFETMECNKKVIITQHYVGEDTSFIEKKYPKLWNYLSSKLSEFNKRKSIIYRNKSKFSIFGIGDYSFLPYKIAISSMYKKPSFSLISPIDGKTVMLDDTCYFIGFNSYKNALFVNALLNSSLVEDFLSSLVFLDSQRVYTKDILMRISLNKVSSQLSFEDIQNILREHNYNNYSDYSESDYITFKKLLKKIISEKLQYT